MILAALVLQAAAPQSAVDAERAFNAAAQARGQWTAFRAFAAEDATMFVPQPVQARQWLKDRKDPPRSIEWWPTESWVSCDGKSAVNTGGWKLPEGRVGFFSTVWRLEAEGGWKWTIDGGEVLETPRERPAEPRLRRASCTGKAVQPPRFGYREGPSESGASADGTLAWHWHVSSSGARQFVAWIWDGKAMVQVVDDRITGPGK
ncbi:MULTISPECIES: hypothetical protein [unclassified Sphingomonas]|jgi:hypothetical protein|uniref:hypothetical protein n=1 Tax=unclassified Sphingomonas TaxID=196159 RepID=UPI0010F9AE6A|nr:MULTISPECIES: hypothetical protein [unclassified Sphingomonas]MCP4638320.1 hypothetical protein [Methyloversatilis sp.]